MSRRRAHAGAVRQVQEAPLPYPTYLKNNQNVTYVLTEGCRAGALVLVLYDEFKKLLDVHLGEAAP